MRFLESRGKRYSDCSISFYWNGKEYEFSSTGAKELYREIIDWLYNNGYKFDGPYHSNPTRKIHTTEEVREKVKTTAYSFKDFHNIKDTDKWIMCATPIRELFSGLIKMLKLHTVSSIITRGMDLEDIDDSRKKDEIIPASEFIKKTETEKTKTYEKSPFGCKQEDGEETSALCILGKSGSGKTTTTEQALDVMGHEYLLYIPIEGEYTFSQYTGEGFEMSSLGEFVMRAQNDPSRCYTVIFDECHRPITISKLNTDLLQALSSRRNRGGERFFTIDRVTKRMYTTPTEEFPIPLKEKSGKILVPDNFGIVCLSSQPAVICRNEDFLNRVDLSVFQKSDRGLTDITLLEKIDKSKIKGTELTSTINALLANEGE